MDTAAALVELSELSSHVVEAVVSGPNGAIEAATVDDTRALELAGAGADMLEVAGSIGADRGSVSRIEIELAACALFVVREDERTIVATTAASPTAALVVFDLRTALRRSDGFGSPAGGQDGHA
jgi:hypothetical protein